MLGGTPCASKGVVGVQHALRRFRSPGNTKNQMLGCRLPGLKEIGDPATRLAVRNVLRHKVDGRTRGLRVSNITGEKVTLRVAYEAKDGNGKWV